MFGIIRNARFDDMSAQPILFKTKNFTVKIQETKREYLQLQRLRYDVFYREFQNKKFPFGFDRDKYEDFAKHIIVIENHTQKVIGCYRVILSDNTEEYYSSSEFNIANFMNLPGSKIELSRACIQKNYRKGAVISVLWRGVSEYLLEENADYLFGIPSIKTTDIEESARYFLYFKTYGFLDESLDLKPNFKHKMESFQEACCRLKEQKNANLEACSIPPLLRSYLKAGAKVLGEPAIDHEFQCIDFFVALKKENIHKRFREGFCK